MVQYRSITVYRVPQYFNRVSQWLNEPYTPIYKSIPYFKQFWNLFFVSKIENSKREKQLQQGVGIHLTAGVMAGRYHLARIFDWVTLLFDWALLPVSWQVGMV